MFQTFFMKMLSHMLREQWLILIFLKINVKHTTYITHPLFCMLYTYAKKALSIQSWLSSEWSLIQDLATQNNAWFEEHSLLPLALIYLGPFKLTPTFEIGVAIAICTEILKTDDLLQFFIDDTLFL